MSEETYYKKRFENLLRVVKKVTSSLFISDILEIIRDEARASIHHAKEVCLLMFDPEASHYTRPLHCAVYKDRINCQLCKRGKNIIREAMEHPLALQCVTTSETKTIPLSETPVEPICEIALPIFDGDKPLAVLDVIAVENETLQREDFMLLKDLADLATNAIVNARKHWKMSQEKLTMDSILTHLRPFVPETVQRMVEKDPFAPPFEKEDVDLSVLFLDVAGYTKISENLSREKLNFIIEKFFSSFLDIIYGHGGDINETAGDGLMILFQGPEQTNALNAVRAALEIRDKTNEINIELKQRFEPINVNMGINSGIASLGMTRFHGSSGTRMTFTASGPVTNLAARIAAMAKEGDILLGPETARRIGKDLDIFDRGLKAFKNVSEEVHVFSLVR
jgi:class 3 adenylate cyclase